MNIVYVCVCVCVCGYDLDMLKPARSTLAEYVTISWNCLATKRKVDKSEFCLIVSSNHQIKRYHSTAIQLEKMCVCFALSLLNSRLDHCQQMPITSEVPENGFFSFFFFFFFVLFHCYCCCFICVYQRRYLLLFL